jgi:DNA-binding NarL/FixJ family response regulator
MALRCVIVDDSDAVLQAAGELLEGEGIAVVAVATTVAEAVRLVRELRPDVTLVDIDLGGESGLDLVRSLAGEHGRAGARCIAISTHAEADYEELIADSQAIGFLAKSELSRDAIVRLMRRT